METTTPLSTCVTPSPREASCEPAKMARRRAEQSPRDDYSAPALPPRVTPSPRATPPKPARMVRRMRRHRGQPLESPQPARPTAPLPWCWPHNQVLASQPGAGLTTRCWPHNQVLASQPGAGPTTSPSAGQPEPAGRGRAARNPQPVWVHAATRRCGCPADSSDLASGAATSTPSLLWRRPDRGLRPTPSPVTAGDPLSPCVAGRCH